MRAFNLFDDLPSAPAEAAIELACRGVKVFPCDPISKAPLVGSGGLHKASNDPRKVEGWFVKIRSNEGAAIGLPTGIVNGFVVLDIDTPEAHKSDGFVSLDVLAAHSFDVPESPLLVKTASGGRHIYFRCPPGGLKSRNGLAPGIDLKADGGYVICPPSRRPDGSGWEVDNG